ncbi:hypothetical protein OS493_017270 [Desmophyllum pertusum]|uniref:Uncharacterized protein n=1 Tax=Desmophyllum pertusum TaxID=174260 RepID=A0A9X0DB46_9CNID|nr:hypothetical protein OS493_017270 [Desmophyllum pertusum]
MPYRECFQRSTLPKLVDDHLSSGKGKEWTPTSSQVNASERLRFQTYSDKLSGGIQYWHKTGAWNNSKRRDIKKPRLNLSQQLKCAKCGGLLANQISFRANSKPFTDRHSQCAFGREYCDVIGPCAECCLTEQRNAIVEKQTVEFPGLEVTPRRLVAPALVQVMMSNTSSEAVENVSEHGDQSHQSRSGVLELPPISLDTLRYMRKEAGSSKHKRNSFNTEQKPTFKKYIEIRLPKI